MPETKEEACNRCRYAVTRKHVKGPGEERSWLECRRYAPRPFAKGPNEKLYHNWPSVKGTDFCGECEEAQGEIPVLVTESGS